MPQTQQQPQLPEGFSLVGYTGQGDQEGQEPQQMPELPEGFTLVGYTGQQQPQEQQPGLISRAGDYIKEAVSGAERTTPELESLNLIMDAPELNELSFGAAKSGLGFLLTGDAERQKAIIENNFPDATFRQDDKGNYIAELPSGDYALQKPGLDITDIASTFVQGGLSYMTGGFGAGVARGAGYGTARTAGTLAAAEGATSLAREKVIEDAGGGFAPENVVLDTLLTGTLEAAPRAIQGISRQKRLDSIKAQRAAREIEAQRVASPASPESHAARQESAVADIAEAVQADRSILAKSKDLPANLKTSQDIAEAGMEFGQEVPLGVTLTDTAQRESVMGLSSQTGSRLGAQFQEGLNKLRQSANDLITEFGGTDNKAGLAGEMKTVLQDTIEDLARRSDAIYDSIGKGVNRGDRVNVDNVRQNILDYAQTLSTDVDKGIARLDPLRKRILKTLDAEDTTYALLDRERKAVGEAIGKARGVYKDQSSADLNTMYSLLTDAQENALNAIDPNLASDWSAGKALVAQRKAIEEQSVKVLGKELTGDLFKKLGGGIQQLGGRTGYSAQLNEVIDLLDHMPKDLREEVIASSLSFGFSKGGQASEQLQLKSFNSFYKNLNKNKEAKEKLFKYLPEGAKQRLDRFNVLTEAYQKADEARIHTGKIVETYKGFDIQGLGSKMYGAVQDFAEEKIPFGDELIKLTGRNRNEPLTAAADKMLSDPRFRDMALSYANTSGKARAAQEKASRALEKSETFQRWADLLPEEEKFTLARIGVLNYFREDS